MQQFWLLESKHVTLHSTVLFAEDVTLNSAFNIVVAEE